MKALKHKNIKANYCFHVLVFSCFYEQKNHTGVESSRERYHLNVAMVALLTAITGLPEGIYFPNGFLSLASPLITGQMLL